MHTCNHLSTEDDMSDTTLCNGGAAKNRRDICFAVPNGLINANCFKWYKVLFKMSTVIFWTKSVQTVNLDNRYSVKFFYTLWNHKCPQYSNGLCFPNRIAPNLNFVMYHGCVEMSVGVEVSRGHMWRCTYVKSLRVYILLTWFRLSLPWHHLRIQWFLHHS